MSRDSDGSFRGRRNLSCFPGKSDWTPACAGVTFNDTRATCLAAASENNLAIILKHGDEP